jgi:hypothetical protein
MEINSVDYTTDETLVAQVVTRLSVDQMAQLERTFPQPVITATTSPLEAAAHVARQAVFKALRDGFVTTR